MIESDVKKALKKYLTEIGAYWYMPVGTGYGKATIDFLICWEGHFIGIETKRPGTTAATPRQNKTMAEIIQAEGMCWVENDPGLTRTRVQFRMLGCKS